MYRSLIRNLNSEGIFFYTVIIYTEGLTICNWLQIIYVNAAGGCYMTDSRRGVIQTITELDVLHKKC